ncbi:hypothetical protein G7B40_005225 [Aetokthonos hydrillicola Thurmond2011]|jgi:hypothetical protein|uniref:Uncharacterized protein n=1 Tax=Aetokthonos hydrillicola Thurmond2011 TaxID=2712845 RepID=A0AAP5M947_9CYAN|nr:hypothetical protein [Aetokthonos hydrillicola]MBO3457350.1 hypothetical protein [Aetokthonos hydrillicola CCALA 1050]MBW4586699.1 hypothetical protein [Aetokthonos hydrillicola CCALA 1050]MDR9893974.1 hypothetical protein [Aetokthonos hydrillicola Thurmond2011]
MNQPPLVQQKVNNPSLTLYAFHLCHSLSESSEQVSKDAPRLWEQLAKLGELLNIEPLKSLKSTIEQEAVEKKFQNQHFNLPLELLGNQRTLKFQVPVEPNTPQVSGAIYPIRIHDTYAVDLTLRYKELVDVTQLSELNPNGYLLSSWMRPSLGETLLLFAEAPDITSNYQPLADACVNALLSKTTQPQPQPTCINQGKLFGSPIFEYDNDQQDPIQRCHLWIWFKTDDRTLTSIAETEDYVLNLLCCRSKILFAYHQARSCYWEARKLSSELESQVEIFTKLPQDSAQRLEKLKTLLIEMSPRAFQYARQLRDMHEDAQSIITNTKNYSTWLAKISQKSVEKFCDDDLRFLENFRDSTCQRLQQQIQTDLNYLSPGQQMFQQAIAISRGLVEIDQAERDAKQEEVEKQRDRTFQITAYVVASGLAVGGIFASVSSQVTKENPIQIPGSPKASSLPHPFVLWFFASIISGLVAAWIVWLVTKYWQKKSEQSRKS